MRSVCVLLVLVVAAIASAAPALDKPHYDINDADALFEKFIKQYNRNYKDDADKKVHFQAFVETLKLINKSNDSSGTATFDINKFSDYTEEERKNLLGLGIPQQ